MDGQRALAAALVVLSAWLPSAALAQALPPVASVLTPHPLTPDDAVDLLKAGSARAQTGERRHELLSPVQPGVRPLAAVLTSLDSAYPPAALFDRRPGEILTVAVRGHRAGPQSIESLEHAAGALGAPVIVVLGRIGSATENGIADDRSLATTRVARTVENLLSGSLDLSARVRERRLTVLGALRNRDGHVEWLGRHARQAELTAHAAGTSPRMAEAWIVEPMPAAAAIEPPAQTSEPTPPVVADASASETKTETVPNQTASAEPAAAKKPERGRIVIRNGRAVRVDD